MTKRRLILFLGCCWFLVACPGDPALAAAATQASFAGGDGSAIEKAVLIEGAPNEGVGVGAEYEWVRQHLPGFRVTGQRLLNTGGRAYDALAGVLPNGEGRTVFFDITEFFGKY